jgi:hypothetical protein
MMRGAREWFGELEKHSPDGEPALVLPHGGGKRETEIPADSMELTDE